jgi:hypothetical protein
LRFLSQRFCVIRIDVALPSSFRTLEYAVFNSSSSLDNSAFAQIIFSTGVSAFAQSKLAACTEQLSASAPIKIKTMLFMPSFLFD